MTTASNAAGRLGGAALLEPESRPRSLAYITVQRFLRHKIAVLGALILLVIAVCSIFIPFGWAAGPLKTNVLHIREAPNDLHLLGTDEVGRDVWTRLLYGGRVSLAVGLAAVSISLTIGMVMGSISGYYGGIVDEVLVRVAEAVLCFPRLIIIITLVAVVGPSLYNLIFVIGVLGWPSTYRLVRSQFLSLKQRDFVIAARLVGAKDSRIMFRHCLPNALSPVIVAGTFGVAGAILTEASLGFLGLGVQPPDSSWGNMLNAAQGLPYLEGAPWLWLPPALLISISVISINLIGDALRDATDPRTVIR